ncbi:MAG: ABC transporter permease [Acidobacteriota bacterium]
MRSIVRSLSRQPVLAAAIVATLALGVGVATALFVYLDSFLHPRLAAPDAARVVAVYVGSAEEPRQQVSYLELQRLEGSPLLHDAVATSTIGAALGGAALPEGGSRYAWGQAVSGRFFAFFAAQPELGRLLAEADNTKGAPGVVVLGHGVWQDAFGGDRSIVGRSVRINGQMLTVVGVTRREFTGLGFAVGFFVPLVHSDLVSGVARLESPAERWLRVFVRLPKGTTQAVADGAIETLTRELDQSAPLAGARRALLLPATTFDPESASDPFFHAARALTGAAILFLLLGSANVAGLLLARAAAREREWAVRKALGASPGQLLGALAAEIALPALLGAAGGLLVARSVARWLESMMLTPIGGIGPGWSAPGGNLLIVDARAAAFALTASLITTFVALLPPLVRVLRNDPNLTLRSGDHRAGVRLGARRFLVALELALAVVLLVGGGLLARSLTAAAEVDLGFSDRGLVQSTVFVTRSGGAKAALATWNAILERTRHLPAISSATLAHVAPNTGLPRVTQVATVENATATREVRYNIVAPNYFGTLGVPLLAGRALDERDTPQAPAAVVVSHSLAERLFGSVPALGRRIRVSGPARPGDAGPEFEIVGVAADAATVSPLEPREPTVFFAYGQRTHSRMTLLARSTAPLATLEPALRRAVAAAAPDAAIIDLVSSEEQRRRSLSPMRINATLAVGLAGMSLLTAVAGLWALQMFAVSLRRRELGIRLALGAQRGRLARLILGESLRLGSVGALLGLAGALVATRWLRSMLFGVGALDPWTLAAVPLGLLAVVLVAAWLPARRAARTDPAESLRAL